MSTSIDLQTLIYERLVADARVHALVEDRIFDRVPADADYPCITFGPSDYSPEDMDCIKGRDETLQLDCWAEDHGRLRPAKEIADAVKKALHQFEADAGDSALITMTVEAVRVMRDRDGITGHGIVTVTANLEEA
ncbi:DUF3168 domain-containing protein [Sulfitobacter sp. W002]|uniref:DUF3168 domain-containing protein n=1 Tax=Sulfitobacter sp. W002 TaxID=2867024 RepID=UPI0021A38D35|nr:DUF3168 domain-containing protein [Sulfitobacter sp. W002]UWR30434.1 DUF3168 domain-containing protein [Sulfitobacter sp. W002]